MGALPPFLPSDVSVGMRGPLKDLNLLDLSDFQLTGHEGKVLEEDRDHSSFLTEVDCGGDDEDDGRRASSSYGGESRLYYFRCDDS